MQKKITDVEMAAIDKAAKSEFQRRYAQKLFAQGDAPDRNLILADLENNMDKYNAEIQEIKDSIISAW